MRLARQWISLLALTEVVNLTSALLLRGGSTGEQERARVVVDVVVTDKENRRVSGLREQDFQAFENKERQEIRSFTVHELQATAGAFNSPKLPENTFTNVSDSEMQSLNVILLDQMITSTEDQRLALQEVSRYLAQKSPGSYFAIFIYRKSDTACQSCDGLRMLQGITANKELLVGALSSREAEPKQPALLMSGVAATPGAVGVPTVGGVPTVAGMDPYQMQRLGWQELEDTNLRALSYIGNFLKELPGRKQLIWLSDTFDAGPLAERADIWFPPKFRGWQKVDPVSTVQTLHLTADRLAMSRVAVYPIDLSGKSNTVEKKRLCVDFPPYLHTESEEDSMYFECKAEGMALNYTAAQTGGQAFHDRNRIQEAIARAVDEGTNYYTVSYEPAKGKLSGKLRNVRITLAQKDYQLRFRHRYWADDPAIVFRPGTESSPDIILPLAGGCTNAPGRVGGISNAAPVQLCGADMPQLAGRIISPTGPDKTEEPILDGMRYGGPELKGVIFEVKVTANGKPKEATAEQMRQVADFESFRDDSVAQAMVNLTKEEKKTKHHGQTVLNSLPLPDPVYLQRFWLDCSIAANELKLTLDEEGNQIANLEIAVVAFDERGKKVAGLKDTISVKFSASQLLRFEKDGYHKRVDFDVPERGSVLRVAVRDVSQGKLGALEIPVWAIKNPFQRRRLKVPVFPDGDTKKETAEKVLRKKPKTQRLP